MAKASNDAPRGKRFTSEASATNFANRVGGTVNDLRGNENRKSDFKVNYTKGGARDGHKNSGNSAGYDFDSDLNGNGTHWHTAEDL